MRQAYNLCLAVYVQFLVDIGNMLSRSIHTDVEHCGNAFSIVTIDGLK